jgi:hypothetical protein
MVNVCFDRILGHPVHDTKLNLMTASGNENILLVATLRQNLTAKTIGPR